MEDDDKPAGGISRRRFIKGAALGGIGAAAVFSVGTSQRLELTTATVPVAGLAPSFDGFRIAFAADFHLGPHFTLAEMKPAVDRLVLLPADLILLGGDYVTHNEGDFDTSIGELSRLSAPHGVYAVPGNHDYWSGVENFRAAMKGKRIKELTNRGFAIDRDDGSLWIAGMDDLWGGDPDFQAACKGVPEGAPKIVVCHNPCTNFIMPGHSADLILSGHTHGWQIYVPVLTRMFVPSSVSKFRAGFYRTGAGRMFVTRGVGMISPPVRLWCRPEVVLFTLRKAGTA